MNDILIVFLSLSVSGSILALVLLAIKPLVKNRLSQAWQYYIWLIVVLRFLFPFTPQFSVVGEISRYIQNISNPPIVMEADPGISTNTENIIPQAPDNLQNPQPLAQQQIKTETPTQFMYWHSILNNIWLLWVGVALVLFVHKVASYRSFVRFIKLGMKKIADKHVVDIYQSELAAAKVKRQLLLYENNQAASPMLVGIIHPVIVIPALDASDDELRNILRHELTHYKRLDFLYKWIVQITLCLHWFNPLVYLINRQINKSCELSCDEAVIKTLDVGNRIIYGDALIASLKAQGNYSDFVVSMTMSDNVIIVKERLDMIMSYKKKSKLMFCTTIMLTTLLLCGAMFTGAYAANSNNISASTNATGKQGENKQPQSSLDDNSEYTPYLPFGITVSSSTTGNDVLYYNGQRVRLLIDQREDGSFNLLFSDKGGTVDLNVKRNHRNKVTSLEYLDENTAKSFIAELDFIEGNAAYPAYPFRLTMAELPLDLNDWIGQSDHSKGVFVLQYNGRYFVYCNSILGEAAWQPPIDNTNTMLNATLSLYDLGGTGDGYILLCLPLYESLTITYKDTSVSVSKDTVQTISTNPIVTGEQQLLINKSTVHKVENGKLTVPFSITSIEEGTEGYSSEKYGYVCLGQVPNIKDAKRIIYDVDADSGTGLFVAMGIDDKSVTHKYDWYNFSVTPQSSIDKTLEGSKGKIGGDFSYSGNYYLYVGTTKTELTNITGVITIEY